MPNSTEYNESFPFPIWTHPMPNTIFPSGFRRNHFSGTKPNAK
uniref:Uncharacterized protein n=1 Tax=Marseillevirus sp. TaxID=2809551 RepID=A0AA96EPS6_9VIRU|nr:hypothetical protein MarDSR_490 [Marseillevirus sp.]